MDSAFENSKKIEQQGMEILLPYARGLPGVQDVLVTLDRESQRSLGDFRLQLENESKYIECKVEAKYTGNLFLETWSNRWAFTTGWMYHLQGDYLWYYFLDTDELHVLYPRLLCEWAFGVENKEGKIYRYKEAKTRCPGQLNDTWGRLVPIVVLKESCVLRGPYFPKKRMAEWKASS